MSLILCKKYILLYTVMIIIVNDWFMPSFCSRSINKQKKREKYTEKCYDELGCVKFTPEWTHSRYRPYNELPSDRHVINTIFINWSNREEKITPEIIGTHESMVFNDASNIKILIHDFTSNGYSKWIKTFAAGVYKLKKCPDMRIISVDWASGAEPPYLQAISNARLVAMEIDHFLKKIKKSFNIDYKKIHIIGHGVGGHIAGYVGKITRLYRITALDPSGPFFIGMPPAVKLNKDDAEFVEVLHTDATISGQGTEERLGHVDFYANDGKNQPKCTDSAKNLLLTEVGRKDLKLGQIFAGCSHKRSLTYYIEALCNSNCNFVAVACSSYKEFLKGKCTNCGENNQFCFRLHPLSTPRQLDTTRRFYFVTSGSSPYCVEMIKVTTTLKVHSQPPHKVLGYLNLTVHQDKDDISFLLNEQRCTLLSLFWGSRIHSFLVIRATPPSLKLPAKSININWDHGLLPCFMTVPPKISFVTIQKLTDSDKYQIQNFTPTAFRITDGIQLKNFGPFNSSYDFSFDDSINQYLTHKYTSKRKHKHHKLNNAKKDLAKFFI